MAVFGGQYVSFDQVRDSFVRNGLPPAQAANFAAVFMKEGAAGGQGYTGSFGSQSTEHGGSLNPSGAYGLGQWNADRQGSLATHAQSLGLSPSNLDAQTSFAIKEAGQRGVDLNSISSIVNKYEVPAQQYRAGEIAGATKLAAGAGGGGAPSGMLANQFAGPGATGYAPPGAAPYSPGTNPNDPANWYRADPSTFKDEGITGPSPTSPMATGAPTPPSRPSDFGGAQPVAPSAPGPLEAIQGLLGGPSGPAQRASPYGALGPGPATTGGAIPGTGFTTGGVMGGPAPSPLVEGRSIAAGPSSPFGALGPGPTPVIPSGGAAPLPVPRPLDLGGAQPVAPSAPNVSAPGVPGLLGSPSGPAAGPSPNGMLYGPQQPTMPVGSIPQAAPPPMPAAPAPAAPAAAPAAAAPASGVASGLSTLAGALGGGKGGGQEAPQPMAPPTIQDNTGAIAQMAPQLMAQVLAKQKKQELEPFGLSLGGYFG